MPVTPAPANPFVFGKSSIIIKLEGGKEIEFGDVVESSVLDMPENFADWSPVSGRTQRIPVAAPSTFTPTFAQDLTEGSLFMFLLQNRGRKAHVTNKPISSKEGTCSFDCTLGRPAQFGGGATSIATTKAQLPLIGEPVFSSNAPTTGGGEG